MKDLSLRVQTLAPVNGTTYQRRVDAVGINTRDYSIQTEIRKIPFIEKWVGEKKVKYLTHIKTKNSEKLTKR